MLLSGVLSSAQRIASRPLIVERVNENQLVTLRGNTPPVATEQNDRGQVNPHMSMSGLILVLHRSPEQQEAFDAFVASQYDPTSPNFHRWLQPEEVGEKFGPALADIATVSSWLGSHGLAVEGISKDRMTIRFSGNAAQVQTAFHTEIHDLVVKGESHFSNMSDPQIPIALDPVVLGPKALHNFIPRPLHRTGGKATFNPETNKWQRLAAPEATSSGVHPEMGFSCGTSCQLEDVTPFDFATIYNVAPLWSSGTDGTGQTIAIAGRSDVRTTDVASFRSTFGLTGGAFNTIHNLESGTVDPGYCTSTAPGALCTLDDQIENALDVEWSGAVAPKATVALVVTQQTNTNDAIFDSAQYVITNKTAPIINVSYGQCELFLGTGGNTAYNTLWQSAATQGIAVFTATGDSGSPSCDQGGDSAGTPYPAKYGLTVSGIASTPFNTAVGGTDFNWGATAAPYWNATNNSSNGSTAKGYMPETPWNDSCTNPLALNYFQKIATYLNNHSVSAPNPTDAESACNFVKNYWTNVNSLAGVDISGYVDTIGASGGASNCTSSNGASVATCTGGYAKPSWQTGVTGIPNDSKRDIPDVSFFAGNGLLGSAYLICVSDWGVCVTSPTTTVQPTTGEIGGTSASSPAMAGVMALINQKAGSAQGNPNSQLYVIAGKQTYSSCKSSTGTTSNGCYFNDIDTGTIAMPCASGSPNCTVSTGGDTVGILSGFAGATGYDEATGLGSLNVANVVNGWNATVIGTATATVTVTPTPSSINVNQAVSVAVTVSGASGAPTGTVSLSGGGYTASGVLVGGAYTFNIPANSLSGGTDTLTVSYSGDPTYATASGTTSVTVTKLTPTVTVVPAQLTIMSNVSLTVTGTVGGSGGTPTGTVTLSGGGYTSSAAALSSGSYTITIPANSLSAGSDTLTVTYSGDSNFASASNSAVVTVTTYVPLTPMVTVTAPGSINTGQSLNVTVAVTGSGATPTGTVTLSGGGYTSTAQTLTAGAYTFAIPSNSLSAGTDTFTASSLGDNVYSAGTGTANVTVTASAFALAATAPASISRGSSATSTVNWSSTTNYSGTVTLSSCTLIAGAPTNSVADTPTCSVSAAAIALSASGTATVTTKAATTAMMTRPAFPQKGIALASSGAVLALTLFFGIPARRRSWRVMLGMFLLMMTLGSLAACGGGSSSGGGGGKTTDPGTASGSYVFTVTGTGNPAVTPAPTTTFTVKVN